MAQEDKKSNTKEKDGLMTKISLVSLLIVLLFIIEIYEIINDAGNLIAIGMIGVFILAAVYVETALIHGMMQKKAEEQEEAYNNVYRSEKASYLLMRKYFDQIEQRIASLERKSGLPFKELVTAQKALAKVQISRSRENTEALMNSNDRMIEKIINVQKTMEASAGSGDKEIAAFQEGNKGVLEKQQEILAYLKELESTLKNQIAESADKFASMKMQMPEMPVPEPALKVEEAPLEELPAEEPVIDDVPSEPSPENLFENALEEVPAEMPDIDTVTEPEPERVPPLHPELEEDIDKVEIGDFDFSDILGGGSSESEMDQMLQGLEPAMADAIEDLPAVEEEPQLESLSAAEEPQLSDLEKSDPNHKMTPDEIAALVAGAETEPSKEEQPEEPDMSVDEIAALVAESGIADDELHLDTVLPDEQVQKQPEKPAMPDLSDPGHMMSPDEIAALIANTGALEEPEPVKEEKPAMPDLSDPGHMMSPDEIAALIANM